MILRPGGVTLEQLRVFVPDIHYYGCASSMVTINSLTDKEKDAEDLISKPPTPGLKYRHYSPKAEVVLLDGQNFDLMRKKVLELHVTVHLFFLIVLGRINSPTQSNGPHPHTTSSNPISTRNVG